MTNKITVVDARMGRGKTSAAIRYMNDHKGERRFLYITPYLTEVRRVCDLCEFIEPDDETSSKLAKLKQLMRLGRNIASTHALFDLLDAEALTLAEESGYSLIMDESPELVSHLPTSKQDTEYILRELADIAEDNRVIWRDDGYKGVWGGYKELASKGRLYNVGEAFYRVTDPHCFRVFREVFLLTYLFDGQLIRAYLDCFGFTYEIIGVRQDDIGYCFSDAPDAPPPVDLSRLIRFVEKPRMNRVGEGKNALSVSWYSRRHRGDAEIKALRNNLRTFFERMITSEGGEHLWTTYVDRKHWLLGQRGRFSTGFLALNARATNAYRDATAVAYLVNRFVDPNIAKFFASRGVRIDADQFALAEMLQFIWRSAIRDGKEIDLYIPSRRMRELLKGWMKSVNGGVM